MPAPLTEVTELATALGTLAPDLETAMANRPERLHNVSDAAWARLAEAFASGAYMPAFRRAFANGVAFLEADDGLRARRPKLVEWKGPHRVPGEDVIPADIRIDHVFQVSCKYLSKIVHNSSPARLFDRNLAGEERARVDWFAIVAPTEYQLFYDSVRRVAEGDLPVLVSELSADDRAALKSALRPRLLPRPCQRPWTELCTAVAAASAARWSANVGDRRTKLRLLWRLLRISDAPYFVLGTDGTADVRLRVASAWDWMQLFELRFFGIESRPAGQPEVGWSAVMRDRASELDLTVHGHVEVRWSHGRFQGVPEAKVYLDTPHSEVPGYFPLE